MSKQDRHSLLISRFRALASMALVSTTPSVSTFRPMPRLSVMAQRRGGEPILSRAERQQLAGEMAFVRAFRADVAALPLRLMPAPFFLS